MKKADYVLWVLFVFIVSFSFFSLNINQVFGQTYSSSSGTPTFCVSCFLPQCLPGQVLSMPQDTCKECPSCVDIFSDCKCNLNERFDSNKCVTNAEGVVCIALFNPVCGCDGKTYSNSCVANGEGIKKFTQGECSSSSSGLVCISDNDCPSGVCPNGQTYMAFACLDGNCHQLNFFADPCQFLTSSSSGEIVVNKQFTGIWRGRVIRPAKSNENTSSSGLIVDRILAHINSGFGGSSIITLRLCVKGGKLEGVIHQTDVIEKGVIVSSNVISNNEVEVNVEDQIEEKSLILILRLTLLDKRKLLVSFEDGHSLEAKKISLFRSCTRKPIISSSSSGGIRDCSPKGSCRGENNEELPCPMGTECSGLPAYGCFPPGCPVPICLSPDIRIHMKGIQKRVADIQKGDLVLSDGEKEVKVIKTSMTEAKNHKILRVLFNDGTILELSPSHPTSDGRLFKDLKMGDILDKRLVVETKLIPYNYKYTYDILPDSESGNYYANGILIGSTLAKSYGMRKEKIAVITRKPKIVKTSSIIRKCSLHDEDIQLSQAPIRTEEQIEAEIEGLNQCTVNSDCAILIGFSPCVKSFFLINNKINLCNIKKSVQELIYYGTIKDCVLSHPIPLPKPRDINCINNKCISTRSVIIN